MRGHVHTCRSNYDEPVDDDGRGSRASSRPRSSLPRDRDGRQPRSRPRVPRARRAGPRPSRRSPSRPPRRRRHRAPVRSQPARHRLSVSDRGDCQSGGPRQRIARHPHLRSGHFDLAPATVSLRAETQGGQRRRRAAGQDPSHAARASSGGDKLIRVAVTPADHAQNRGSVVAAAARSGVRCGSRGRRLNRGRRIGRAARGPAAGRECQHRDHAQRHEETSLNRTNGR